MTHEHFEDHESATPLEEILDAEGVSELARLVDISIAAADHEDRQISFLTARNIAYLFSRTVTPIDGPLGGLTTARHADAALARAAANEAAPVGTLRDIPRDLARWIGWLGTWALSVATEGEPTPAAPSGDAFHAFLLLPDSSPDDPALLSGFEEQYVGTFTSIRELTVGLSDIDAWRDELREFAEARGIGNFVRIDDDSVARSVLDVYDVVTVRGKLVAFKK